MRSLGVWRPWLVHLGVSQIKAPFEGPYSKDDRILGSTLGSPCSGKLLFPLFFASPHYFFLHVLLSCLYYLSVCRGSHKRAGWRAGKDGDKGRKVEEKQKKGRGRSNGTQRK